MTVMPLGAKLAAQLPDAPFPYTFAITTSDWSNFLREPVSLPGGYIFISPLLFRTAQVEAEFAGMLAHAMAHVAARTPCCAGLTFTGLVSRAQARATMKPATSGTATVGMTNRPMVTLSVSTPKGALA